MKFEHLEFTDEEVKKLGLAIFQKDVIWDTLEKIHKRNMKAHGASIGHNFIYEDMKERCFLFDNETEILVLKKVFKTMIKIYKNENKYRFSLFLKIKKFNPLMAMFLRNQISEC